MILLLAWALLGPPTPVSGSAPPRNAAASRTTASGQLRSAGLRQPLAGARIHATSRRGPAWTRDTVTASDGSFTLTDLPTRDFLLTVVAPDHERLIQPTTAAYWSARRPPVLYLQPTGSAQYRTIVAAARDPRPSVTSTHLSPAEIATLPGSQGDPLRALQNLPGSARIPGGLGLLVMRGATPNQSQVFYGEHPIPRAFHFPGLASMIPGAALAGIQYTPGNFDAAHGNAVGGIVLLAPRNGRRDGVHGMAKLDITTSGAMVEGPLGRGSFLIGAQRGYLDLVLRRFSDLSGSPLPRSYDYQAIFNHPVGHGSITTRFLGGSDSVHASSGANGGRNNDLRSEFHRVDLSLRQRLGITELLVAPAVRFDRSGFDTDGNHSLRLGYHRHDTVGLLRTELIVRPSPRFRLTVGLDTQLDHNTILQPLTLPATAALGPPTRTRGLDTRTGLYVEPLLTLRTVTLAPALRINAFTSASSRAASVDPRLTLRWAPHRRVSLALGVGQYSQPIRRQTPIGSAGVQLYGAPDLVPLPAGSHGIAVLPNVIRYLDDPLAFPNGPLGVSQALHLSANVHVDILASLGVDATVFYRRVRDGLPPLTSDTGQPIPDTGSLAWGIEALVRKQLTRRLQGWIAYTFMHSVQGTLADHRLTRRLAADFDQRHNLVAVLSVKLPKRWELGARFRVVTGLPYTPIVGGITNADTIAQTAPDSFGQAIFLVGRNNSRRLGLFHQLDLRVDRTWVLRRCIVGAYLDIQNIYNRQNPEGLIYNPHYTAVATAVGLPILPILGARVDY